MRRSVFLPILRKVLPDCGKWRRAIRRGAVRLLLTFALGAPLLSAFQPPNAPPDQEVGGRRAASNRVIVKLRNPSRAAIDRLRPELDADTIRGIGGIGAHIIHSRSRHAAELVALLANRPDVEYAEPDYVASRAALPNDPSFPSQWALRNTGQIVNGAAGTPGADIHAAPAWDVATGGLNTVVGIVDGGFDYTHPDLVPNVWSAPTSFFVTIGGSTLSCPAGSHGLMSYSGSLNCDPMYPGAAQHATHVAGIVGAAGNNQLGVSGVDWHASLMSLNFLNGDFGYYSDAINVIEFAVQVKLRFADLASGNVRVLNSSWGGSSYSQALRDEIDRAGANDILMVAAAMNLHQNLDASPQYPASFNRPNMIAVASTDSKDQLSSFSNYSANSVHLAAPGENILSTVPGASYGYMYGTSMATPLVAGAAALVLSRCPMSTGDLKALIINSVDHLGQLAGVTITGGRLNVANALQACAGGVSSAPPTVVLTAPTDGAAYTQPASIGVAASAADPDGSIARIDFYAGATLIGAITTPPYAATWSNVSAGTYALSAVATDTNGLHTRSDAVRVTVTAPASDGSLPPPWQHQDVGTVGVSGSTSYSGGTFTVRGAGGDIGGYADSFQYGYQPLAGDGEIVARITTVESTQSAAKAGLVLRETLAANAPAVTLLVRPGGTWEFASRSGTGQSMATISSGTQRVPAWLKLRRIGYAINGFVSNDGIAWTRVGQAPVSMAPNNVVGFAVTSGDTTLLNTATFEATSVVGGTAAELPASPNAPTPTDGSTGVSINPVLTWYSPDATSFDVRLGTTSPPPLVSSGQTARTYTTPTLAGGATYFWQVVAYNGAGATTGPIWSFTTSGTRPTPADVVIYASDIAASARHGSWTIAADSTAAAGARLQTADAGWSSTDTAVASPTDYVDVAFEASGGVPYTVWLRMQALNNVKYNDSLWVQFSDASANGSPAYPIGTTTGLCVNLATDSSAASLNGWGWQNRCYWLAQATTVTFAAGGTHTMRIAVREDGVQFDQIVLSPGNYLNAAPGAATDDHTIVPKPNVATPPGVPASPNPATGSTGVSTTPTLSWSSSGATSYDVSFGTSNPPPIVSTGQTGAIYTPPRLFDGTTYFWQVVAHNGDGATTGPRWTFTTAAAPSTGNIVVYAGDLSASARHGAWNIVSDATAAAGVKLAAPDAGWSSTAAPLASPVDYVDVTFSADAGVPYAIWLRVQALNNSKYNDSLWVQFSDAMAGGSAVYPLGSASGLCVNLATDVNATSLNGWGWQNGCYWLSQPATITFATSGMHTMRIQLREDGVQFDQIVLSPSTYLSSAPGAVTNDHIVVPKT